MGQLALVRIDARLIHGQVCTQWLYRTGAKKIYIIDDTIARDEFLAEIFYMATLVGTKLEVITAEEAGKRWVENGLGDTEPIFILFKGMKMAHKAYYAGFRYPSLQVGSIGGGAGRKNVLGPISFSDEDARMFEEMVKDGVDGYFQPVPEDKKTPWADVKAKHYPDM